MSKTDNILKSLRARPEIKVPVATDMFIPNLSGDLSQGKVLATPTQDLNPTNKKYVDDAIASSTQIKQIVDAKTNATTSDTTTIPIDDTIPQNTEGTEYLTCTITPTSATNTLIIDVIAPVSTPGDMFMIGALFQDDLPDAIASVYVYGQPGTAGILNISHRMLAGTVLPTTFKLRCGTHGGGLMGINTYYGGTPWSGGTSFGLIRVTELVL
jgi:hypothetical protein